jgi:hypothetical protein
MKTTPPTNATGITPAFWRQRIWGEGRPVSTRIKYRITVHDETGEAVVGFNASSRWRALLWLVFG